ncbi:MAG: hypothetical protein GX220_09590 [Treponema sp.]|nr:hypothetical protein [Treponema sp.]
METGSTYRLIRCHWKKTEFYGNYRYTTIYDYRYSLNLHSDYVIKVPQEPGLYYSDVLEFIPTDAGLRGNILTNEISNIRMKMSNNPDKMNEKITGLMENYALKVATKKVESLENKAKKYYKETAWLPLIENEIVIQKEKAKK